MTMQTRPLLLTTTLLGAWLVGCGEPASLRSATEDFPMTQPAGDRVVFDFAHPEAAGDWQAVNDTVMGGVSQSAMVTTGAGAAFEGVLSLENFGGFATVRCAPGRYDFGEYDGLAVRFRGDGRNYTLFLKTNARDDGYQYQADVATRRGGWQTVRVAFRDFRPHWRGMHLALWPRLDARKVRSLGFMIADKQARPFRLEIERITAYRAQEG